MDLQIPFGTYMERGLSKTDALYGALREVILQGVLAQGVKLPSSREMADLYGISRGTVGTVYETLVAEGYLESRLGSGTFVLYAGRERNEGGEAASPPIRLSAWAARIGMLAANRPPSGEGPIEFAIGRPDLAAFPFREWNACLYAAVRDTRPQPNSPQGDAALREGIARHLRRARGLDCRSQDIVIVNGSQQAIALLGLVLADHGDTVVVEEPAYNGIHDAIVAAGAVAHPAQLDEHGIVPQPWESRLLFVTPGRQFPTGAALPLQRRTALLQWASECSAVIVEDDYDSEFRHKGKPIEPLKALDRESRVVYIGTFSKTMPRELRLGYVVLPPGLLPAFLRAKRLFEPYSSALIEQRALAAFMASGGYERHLRRMKRLYSSKFLLLSSLLENRLSHRFRWVPSDAGLHVFGWWRGTADDYTAFQEQCRSRGVSWTDGSHYVHIGGHKCACFGFSHLTEAEIRSGVEIMSSL